MITVSKLLLRNRNYKTIKNENSIILQNKDNTTNNSLFKIMTSYSNKFFINKQKEKSFTSKRHIMPNIQSNKNDLNSIRNLKKKDYLEKYIISNDQKSEKKNTDKILLVNNYRLSFDLLHSENNLKEINEEYHHNLKKTFPLNYYNLVKRNEKQKIKEIENFTRKLSEEKSKKDTFQKFYINYRIKTNLANQTSNNIFKKRPNHCRSSFIKNKIYINEPMILKCLINKTKDSESTNEKNTCNNIVSSCGNTVNNYFRKKSDTQNKRVIQKISISSVENHSKVKRILLGLNSNLNDNNDKQGKRRLFYSHIKEIQKERSIKDISDMSLSKIQKETKNFGKNSDILNLI